MLKHKKLPQKNLHTMKLKKENNYIVLLTFFFLIVACNKYKKERVDEFYSNALYEDIVTFSSIEDSINLYKSTDSCIEQNTKELSALIIATEVMIEYFDSVMKSEMENGYEIIANNFYNKKVNGYTFQQNYRALIKQLNNSNCHFYNKQLIMWLQHLYRRIESRIGIGTISEQKATLFLFKKVLRSVMVVVKNG